MRRIKQLIFKGVGMAMGIATLVLLILGQISTETSLILLSIGLISLSLALLDGEGNKS